MNGLRRIPIRHQSAKQQIRNLKRRCATIIDSTDPEVLRVGDRVIASCLADPEPTFGMLHLFAAGLDRAEEKKISWSLAMSQIMDAFGIDPNLKFDPYAYAKAMSELPDVQEAAPEKRLEGRSWFSRLFRSLFSRTFRARHEEAPKADEYQRAGHAGRPSSSGEARGATGADRGVVTIYGHGRTRR